MNKDKWESFKSLRLKHFDLLTEVDEAKDHPASLIPNIKEQIEEWRQAGGYISEAGERDYLRSILSFWGSFVFENSEPKEYPETDLYPLDIKIAQRAKIMRMLKRVVWSVMCVVGVLAGIVGILAFLFGEGILNKAPTTTPTVPSPTPIAIITVSPISASTDVRTPVLTPTSTNTRTNTPTSTNTPSPTDTPTPTPTLTPTPKPDAVVNTGALNLRSGPGTNYEIVGRLKKGDYLEVTGKNTAGNWLKVIAPNGQEGWVAASLLEINLPMDEVALAQIPPAPTPAHTPTAPPMPTAALTLLPAPQLLDPEDRAMFVGNVRLMWEWVRPLAEDEYFSVRIRPEGDPKPQACHYPQTKIPQYEGNPFGCTNGRHYWSVIVARKDPKSPTGWTEISVVSEERWFDFYVGDDSEEGGGGGGPCPGCRP